MNRRATIALLALILVGMGACAARQMTAYKRQVGQAINQHFVGSLCTETGRYHFRIKVDNSYNVVGIRALKGTPSDACTAEIKRAIQASSPWPAAPSIIHYKILEDGFGLNF